MSPWTWLRTKRPPVPKGVRGRSTVVALLSVLVAGAVVLARAVRTGVGRTVEGDARRPGTSTSPPTEPYPDRAAAIAHLAGQWFADGVADGLADDVLIAPLLAHTWSVVIADEVVEVDDALARAIVEHARSKE